MSLRRSYIVKKIPHGYGKTKLMRQTAPLDEADVIGSRSHFWGERQPAISGLGNPVYRTEEKHFPIFDIDYDAQLLKSSTAGHFHLYLNKPVTWRRYKRVLKAMAKAGLVEKGWVKCALRDKEAILRAPMVVKDDSLRSSAEQSIEHEKLKTAEEEAAEKLLLLQKELVGKGTKVDPQTESIFWASVEAEREDIEREQAKEAKEKADKDRELRRANLGPGYW